MKNRCEGCGALIQTVNPNQIGYIKSEVYLKNPDRFLCERCFNLRYYNKMSEIELGESDFAANIQKIASSKGLVVNVVDIFDLEGTYIGKLNEYFPNNKILLVGNKYDLFLNSVKENKVRNYLQKFLKEKNLHVDKTLLMTSRKQNDILRLLQTIDSLQEGNRSDVYLFGMTNVGKSSIINQIGKVLEIPTDITVSNMVGTTLDFIKIPLPNKTFLIDTPGIINHGQVTYYLEKRNLSLLTPKKYIRPVVYQLNPEQALFLGGFCILKFMEGERSSFIAYVPGILVCHRTKLENADRFYQEHADDILKIPNEEERKKMGRFVSYEFAFEKTKKIDITISGLGFVTLSGTGKVRVECFETIRVGVREAII